MSPQHPAQIGKLPVLITTGEPAGIGPDICLLLAAGFSERMVLMGDGNLLQARARQLGLDLELKEISATSSLERASSFRKVRFIHIPIHNKVVPGKPDPANVPYLLALHAQAVDLCLQEKSLFAALVTAPTDKGLICATGTEFIDLSSHLRRLSGSTQHLSLFCGDVAWGQLRVAFVTMHLAFSQVREHLNADLIRAKVQLSQQALQKLFSIPKPQLALCALNPHAGEDGSLGTEEISLLNPLVAQLRQEGIHITGPLSADSLFAPVMLSSYTAVIALYHDQGLAPFKALCFGRGAQLTYGLPFLRSSPDHGTAYALAGSHKPNTGSMKKAIELAWELGNAMKSSRPNV